MKKVHVICESDNDCLFEVSGTTLNEVRHKLTDMEGAIVSDGHEGYISICPLCKEDSLVFAN